ncbi:MAG: phosphoadenosine phosphosulfate reductase family protein, partial [Pyrobaculum sp.]
MVAVYKPFHIFDELAKRFDRFVLAYSGGKDSTAVAILLYQWIKERRPSVDVTMMYGDTLSEINTMEAWARQFSDVYIHKLRDYVDARA